MAAHYSGLIVKTEAPSVQILNVSWYGELDPPVHKAALVRAGDTHCTLALGFEHMARGSLSTNATFTDRLSPISQLLGVVERASPDLKRGPPMPRMFGAAAAEENFRKYGGGVEHLAKIGGLCDRCYLL
ncbi:hypothetical protein EDB86DRAFT_2835717 [Lactarius hatsudake]|nr:hypothetical protein EDB86DRAFT_2835717 [Lactarius hatsudake]